VDVGVHRHRVQCGCGVAGARLLQRRGGARRAADTRRRGTSRGETLELELGLDERPRVGVGVAAGRAVDEGSPGVDAATYLYWLGAATGVPLSSYSGPPASMITSVAESAIISFASSA
jgi:hypothetical protein